MDVEAFSSKIKNNKIVLTLNEKKVIKLSDTEKSILRLLCEKVNHDISEVTVIEDKGKYFAYIKLNVNWHDPCILYEYDSDENSLNELCEWENKDISGISLDVKDCSK